MKKYAGEQGSMNVLLIPVILLAVFFVGAASFAVWAFMSRQDYKNNSDAKSAAAVAANKKVVQAADAAQYAEAAKSPVRTYVGPDAYGSIHVSYPKTWSAYVDTGNSGIPVDAYFHVDTVPSVLSKQPYNLRVQVVARTYSAEMTRLASNVNRGLATAAAYSLPKVPTVVGTKLTGGIVPGNQTIQGVLIMVPMRDKTLEVWTESNDYLADFNTYVVPNLTFSP